MKLCVCWCVHVCSHMCACKKTVAIQDGPEQGFSAMLESRLPWKAGDKKLEMIMMT